MVIGNGTEQKNIIKLVDEYNLRNRFIFITSIMNYDLPKIYCAADIFLLPSINEGFPMVLLESISCGLPSIAFDVGGISEIIYNGVNGWIINKEKHNAKEIIKNINKILDEKVNLDRQKISESINHFSAEIMANILNSLFTSILE